MHQHQDRRWHGGTNGFILLAPFARFLSLQPALALPRYRCARAGDAAIPGSRLTMPSRRRRQAWGAGPVSLLLTLLVALVPSFTWGQAAGQPMPPVVSASSLRLEPLGGGFALLWEDADGVLEEADDVTGPWRPVDFGLSPFVVWPAAAASRKFYRLAAPPLLSALPQICP